MNILPGILESSFNEIEARVEEVSEYAKKVHVDICDGLYVQSKTWPYSGIKTGRIEENFHVIKLMSEEIGLPLWESVEYQFDLMIKDPWRNMAVWAQIGGSSVVIHPTSCDSIDNVIVAINLAQSFMMDVYLAYTYDEWIEAKSGVADLLTNHGVKGLQCMTIKHIGIQGEKFDTRWAEEFSHIAKDFPNIEIQLDGGENEESEPYVHESGAKSVVIGSAIFGEGNAAENISYYKQLFS